MAVYPTIMNNCCFQNCPHFSSDKGKSYCASPTMHIDFWKSISPYKDSYPDYPEIADYRGDVLDPVDQLFIVLEKDYNLIDCHVFREIQATKKAQQAEQQQLAREEEQQRQTEAQQQEAQTAAQADKETPEEPEKKKPFWKK